MSKRVAVIVSLLTGVALELGIQVLTGNREAWDTAVYWTIGLPIVAVVSFGVGFLSRGGPAWRAPVLIIPAQVMTMIVRSGEVGSMLPLGVILGAVLGLPFLGIAYVASRLKPR